MLTWMRHANMPTKSEPFRWIGHEFERLVGQPHGDLDRSSLPRQQLHTEFGWRYGCQGFGYSIVNKEALLGQGQVTGFQG